MPGNIPANASTVKAVNVAAPSSRVSFFKTTIGTQPEFGEPWVTLVSPSNLKIKEPALIDTLIWNAPLQGLEEGDEISLPGMVSKLRRVLSGSDKVQQFEKVLARSGYRDMHASHYSREF